MNDFAYIEYEETPRRKTNPIKINRILRKRMRNFRKARLARLKRMGE